MKRLMAFFLSVMLACGAASAETLTFYYSDAPQAMKDAHPEATFVEANSRNSSVQWYETTSEYAGVLQTRSFGADVFWTVSSSVDSTLLMEKGFLLDLTDSEIIRDAVGRMHPFIQQRCMAEGRIYAIPTGLSAPRVWTPYAPKWEEAGYSADDIPKSFPALLDFIEAHLDRRDADPDLTVCVWHGLDPESYNRHTYADLLLRKLIDSHVLQCMSAGEPVRFNTPEMVALLTRTRDVADRIYTYERVKTYSDRSTIQGLFRETLVSCNADCPWSRAEELAVGVRLRDDQPEIISATVWLQMVNAATQSPKLAIEAIEYALDEPLPAERALLYADAEPVANPEQQEMIRRYTLYATVAEHVQAGDTSPIASYIALTDEDYQRPHPSASTVAELLQWEFKQASNMSEADLRDHIAALHEIRAEYEQNPWRFSPEDLAAYKALAPTLYLVTPNVFTASSKSSQSFETLVSQLSDGLITPDQFAREADRIAEMAELEGQ